MSLNNIRWEKETSLERKKIDFYRYQYFITDDSGRFLFEIDTKYYNCFEIGKLGFDCFDDDDERWYDNSFRYYKFSYDFTTPKYTISSQLKSDSLGDYKETISEEEGGIDEYHQEKIQIRRNKITKLKNALAGESDPDIMARYKEKIEQLEEEIEKIENQVAEDDEIITNEIGGEKLILKAILNDAGKVIKEGIENIHEFISSIGAIVITLPIYKGSIWQKSYDSCWGKDPLLWAVVDLSGNFIIHPVRAKIEFLKNIELFVVGDTLLYNQIGEKEEKEFKDLFSNEDEFYEFKKNRDKYLHWKNDSVKK